MRSRRSEYILGRTMYFYLSHVRVSAVLMISYYSYLNHESSDGSVVDIFYRNDYPAARFVEIHYFDFLKIVKVCSSSDAYSKNMKIDTKFLRIQFCVVKDTIRTSFYLLGV